METLRVVDMSITLIAVPVSWVLTQVQTHWIVHIKYMQFFASQVNLNKTVKVNKQIIQS